MPRSPCLYRRHLRRRITGSLTIFVLYPEPFVPLSILLPELSPRRPGSGIVRRQRLRAVHHERLALPGVLAGKPDCHRLRLSQRPRIFRRAAPDGRVQQDSREGYLPVLPGRAQDQLALGGGALRCLE